MYIIIVGGRRMFIQFSELMMLDCCWRRLRLLWLEYTTLCRSCSTFITVSRPTVIVYTLQCLTLTNIPVCQKSEN